MMDEQQQSRAVPGDRIDAARSGHAPGDRDGDAEVLEVLELPGSRGSELYRVRWEDGVETFYRPGPDDVVRPATRPRA